MTSRVTIEERKRLVELITDLDITSLPKKKVDANVTPEVVSATAEQRALSFEVQLFYVGSPEPAG